MPNSPAMSCTRSLLNLCLPLNHQNRIRRLPEFQSLPASRARAARRVSLSPSCSHARRQRRAGTPTATPARSPHAPRAAERSCSGCSPTRPSQSVRAALARARPRAEPAPRRRRRCALALRDPQVAGSYAPTLLSPASDSSFAISFASSPPGVGGPKSCTSASLPSFASRIASSLPSSGAERGSIP